MKIPFTCPVCGGKGFVPTGFYHTQSGYYITSITEPDKCRTCDGAGIIWGEDDVEPIETTEP